MKKIIYIFVCLSISIYSNMAYAANCPTDAQDEATCEAQDGCVWVGGTVGCRNGCGNGQYYEKIVVNATAGTFDQKCTNCPNSHKDSDVGDNGSLAGISDCYKTCEPIDITGGKKLPTADKAYYNNDCSYTIQCDTTGGTCNKGYHKDGNACIENVRGCSNNTGYEFYQTASDSYSSCYKAQSACTTGTMAFVPSGNMCESVPYGTCVNNEKACSQIGILRTSCGTGSNIEIAGTVPVTIFGFSSQYTDYTDCRCIKRNQPLKNDQDTNIGLATITYKFTNSGELGSVVSTDVTNCYAGYCRQSETATTCIQVPAGQYSGSGELQCLDCTPGATSAAGSTDKSACHYTNQTTFKDTADTFTLPDDDDNIKIEWNWGN